MGYYDIRQIPPFLAANDKRPVHLSPGPSIIVRTTATTTTVPKSVPLCYTLGTNSFAAGGLPRTPPGSSRRFPDSFFSRLGRGKIPPSLLPTCTLDAFGISFPYCLLNMATLTTEKNTHNITDGALHGSIMN